MVTTTPIKLLQVIKERDILNTRDIDLRAKDRVAYLTHPHNNQTPIFEAFTCKW